MSAGPSHRFLACRRCGAMTPLWLPECGADVAVVHATIQEWATFFATHAAHLLLEVHRPLEAPVRGGPIWDPMAMLEFEVQGGGETFLAATWRESVEAPRRYTLSLGGLRIEPATVELDEADVRRALDRELAAESARDAKIQALLDAVHASLDGIDEEAVEIAFDDVDDPDVGIAALPAPAVQRILDAVPAIFDASARPRVERFVLENRGEDGLLALRIRRRAVAVAL